MSRQAIDTRFRSVAWLGAALVCLLVFSAPLLAQRSQQVQVELLAFAWTDAAAAGAVAAAPGNYAGSSFAPDALPGNHLATARQRLAADPGTRPLLHLSWRQGLYDQRWIRLAAPDGSTTAAFDGRLLLRPGKPLGIRAELDLATTDGASHRLRQTRNARYGEFVLLDHPALGLIVRVDPVDAGPEAEAELSDD